MHQTGIFNEFEPCIDEQLAKLTSIKKGSVIFATIAYVRIYKFLLENHEELWHKYVYENSEEYDVINSLSSYIAQMYEVPVQSIHDTMFALYLKQLDKN